MKNPDPRGAFLRYRAAIVATFGFTLLAFIAGAPARAQYVPPTGEAPQGPTVANGARSGCGDRFDFAALAPVGHVGRTSGAAPHLSWFVDAAAPYRVEVSFYRPTDAGPPELLEPLHEEIVRSAGVADRSFLELAEQLESGQRYYWQIAIACDPESPSYDRVFVAELDIVAPSPELAAALAAAGDRDGQARVYAEAGYWYDALREATDPQKVLLLEELAALEPRERGRVLQRIANALSQQQALRP